MLARTASNMSKLQFEIGHFSVILVLLVLNVWGCGGQSLSSKFILKVKKQMSTPKEHVHITFLTPWIVFVGILGFQSITLRCKTPCSISLQCTGGAKKQKFGLKMLWSTRAWFRTKVIIKRPNCKFRASPRAPPRGPKPKKVNCLNCLGEARGQK